MLSRMRFRKPQARGFTLMEMLVVLVIISIIVSLAYPSYRNQIRKTVRKEAVGEVLAMAQRMEKIRAQTFSYAGGDAMTVALAHYSVKSTVAADSQSYAIEAAPNAGDDQQNDVCGTLQYASDNTWTFSTGLSQADCL